MADILQDFIPEGEVSASSGEGGFQDFVPAPKPVERDVESLETAETKEAPASTPKPVIKRKK